MFDKAIEQRARTDEDFGSYWGRFYGLMGYEKSFGSVNLKNLNDLDLSKPIEPEIELAAEVMLADSYYYPHIYHGGENDSEAKSLYAEYFKKQLKPVEDILNKQFKADYTYASDDAALKSILRLNGLDPDELKDPWGQNYVSAFSTEKTQAIVTLTTSGPDKKAGTNDDIITMTAGVPYFTATGEAIEKAAQEYHSKTGKFTAICQGSRPNCKRPGSTSPRSRTGGDENTRSRSRCRGETI